MIMTTIMITIINTAGRCTNVITARWPSIATNPTPSASNA
jgi:hypothetical protein